MGSYQFLRRRFSAVSLLLLICCAALAVLALPAMAQRAVKVQIVPLFDRIPLPPETVKEAGTKAEWTRVENERTANFDKIFKALEDQATELMTKINTPTPEAGAKRDDAMKRMNDPEFKKKMKTMTLSEKMKLAEEMNEAMGVGQKQMVMEPPTVGNVIRIAGQANQEAGGDITKMKETFDASMKESQKDDQAHAAVSKWEEESIARLPDLSTGEMSYKEPSKVRTIRLQAMDKQIVLADAVLKREKQKWIDMKAKMAKRYAALDSAITATNFGDDARNNSSKTMIGSAQAQIAGQYAALIGASKSLFEKGAAWHARKLQLLEEKQ